jgi:hypothetical protein
MSEILDDRSQDMVDLFAKEVNKYNLRYYILRYFNIKIKITMHIFSILIIFCFLSIIFTVQNYYEKSQPFFFFFSASFLLFKTITKKVNMEKQS